MAEQGGTLLRTEPLHTTIVGDTNFFHQPTGFDLADPGERFEHRNDLKFADVYIVGIKCLNERHRPHFQAGFDLSASGASLARFDESCGPLLWCQ